MKIIYLENTLNLLSQIEGIENVNNLVKTGVVKETDGVKYLVIED
jgi:hypothetical protein